MRKPKLLIIVLYQNLGEEHAYYANPPAPPLSGALLAGLTPPVVDIELHHEMVRPIDYEIDADLIALSFMDFCAPHAYEVAARFRARGKTVVAGGRYPSAFPEQVLPHFDSVVVGEAETVWPRAVRDFVDGNLQKLYRAPFAPPLVNVPPPRYDLVESQYPVPVVTEATRGCPFRCSYCALNIRPAPYRVRPIDDVIRDLSATRGLPYHKRKLAMLYDNNLCGDMQYAKELLREIAGLKLWGLGVQFSVNCLHNDEFLDLLAGANCRMAFLGMESVNEPSLLSVNKKHNKVEEYERLFERLKQRGIMTFAGTMLALDEDTPEYYERLPRELERIDPSAIFLSISIPIPGTPFHRDMSAAGRIFDRDLRHYDGDHLVFHPNRVTPRQVLTTFRRINRTFYSWKSVARRWWRLMRSYLPHADWPRRLAPAAVLTAILLRLSIFQRGHGRRRVFPLVAEALAGLDRTAPEGTEHGTAVAEPQVAAGSRS
jgi:radical SAM superfamily enzyme YgiQ (UPF0313 family)